MKDDEAESLESDELETLSPVAETQSSAKVDADGTPIKRAPIMSRLHRPSKTLVISGLIVLLLSGLGIAIVVSQHKSKKTEVKTITINTQTLDTGTLTKLSNQLGKPGAVRQQLTITASTLFKNDVEVQGATTLDNDLLVKGSTKLLGPVATGDSLSVGGGLIVGRNASISGGLSVTGVITATSLNVGSINLTTLSLSGNFSWGGHLISTGTRPTVDAGPVIGNGTATVNGNDSVGTVAINAGSSGLLSDGEMATVHFHSPYSAVPIVQLTPTNQGAAGIPYYVVSAPGFFAVRTIAIPTPGTTYSFNFFVTQ